MTLKKNARLTLKWLCYVGLLLLCLGLQTEQSLFYIGQVKPLFLPTAAFCLCFFEGEIPSALFGLFAGLLWDVAAGKVFGFYGMMMMALCATISLLSSHFLRVNVINALALGFLGTGLVLSGDFLFYHLIWGGEGVWRIYTKYLFILLYTLPFIPPIFWAVKRAARTTLQKGEKEIEEKRAQGQRS